MSPSKSVELWDLTPGLETPPRIQCSPTIPPEVPRSYPKSLGSQGGPWIHTLASPSVLSTTTHHSTHIFVEYLLRARHHAGSWGAERTSRHVAALLVPTSRWEEEETEKSGNNYES